MTDISTEQNIERLRAEAAAHRQAIATDLELVGDRVSPARVVERSKARFRERVSGVRNSVFGSSDRSRAPRTYGYPDAYGAPTGGPARPAPATTTSFSTEADGGSSIGDRASGALDTVKQHTPDSLGEVTEGNPLGAAVIGFGIGMLAASLLPSSPDERRMANKLQGRLEDTAAELGRTGKEAVEHVKPEAQQAVEELKSSAQDSVENVRSEATTQAQSVKDTATTKTDEVRSQV